MLRPTPPKKVTNVLLKPWIRAAVVANAHNDQIRPGTTIIKANTAEKGSSANCKTFNTIKTASTIVMQSKASKNFPFPLNNLPPTVIISENT